MQPSVTTPSFPSVTRHAFGPMSPWASHFRSKIRGLGVPHGSHASQPTEPAGGGEGAETRRNGDETRRDAKRCEKGADKGGIWVVPGSFFPFGGVLRVSGVLGVGFQVFPVHPFPTTLALGSETGAHEADLAWRVRLSLTLFPFPLE